MTGAMGVRWDWGLTARLVSLGWTLSGTAPAAEWPIASGRDGSGWATSRDLEPSAELRFDAGDGHEDDLPDLTTLEAWECRPEARRG
jgi:hypothetical protein